MPLKFLGKVLFPRQAAWQQKKQTKIILWVILAAVIFGVCVAAALLFQNSKR